MMNMLAQAVQNLHSEGAYHCNPDREDCSHILDEEIKEYGLSNLGWSGLFKTIVPDLTAALMLTVFYAYNDVSTLEYKKDYYHKYELKNSANAAKKLESSHPMLQDHKSPYSVYDSGKRGGGKDSYGYKDKATVWINDGWVVYRCGYKCQFDLWLEENGFTDHLFAWFSIGAAFSSLYGMQNFLWILYSWFGWLPSWLAFWIQHIISNFNWAVYGYGYYALIAAAFHDESWTAWIGCLSYLVMASMFIWGEYRLGTDAIRFLDNDYYLDPYLLPSILYLVGFEHHIERPEIMDDASHENELGEDENAQEDQTAEEQEGDKAEDKKSGGFEIKEIINVNDDDEKTDKKITDKEDVDDELADGVDDINDIINF